MLIVKSQNFVEFYTEAVVDETTLITDIVQRFSKDGYRAELFKVLVSNPTDFQLFAKITIIDGMDKVKFKLNQYKEYTINDLQIETYTLDEFSFVLQNDYTKSFLFIVSNPNVGDMITKVANFKFNNDFNNDFLFPTPITFIKIDETVNCKLDLSALQPIRNQLAVTSRYIYSLQIQMPEQFLPNHSDPIYCTDCNMVILTGPNPTANVGTVHNTLVFVRRTLSTIDVSFYSVPVPGTATAVAIPAGTYIAMGGTWAASAFYGKYLMFNYSLI